MAYPLQEAHEIDTLRHLVRKYPEEAMECLSYNQMLEYVLGHKNIAVDLATAKAALISEGAVSCGRNTSTAKYR